MDPHNAHDEDRQAPGARGVLRVLAVLTELAAQPSGMSLALLTERLAVPKPSLHRILLTLRQSGYLSIEHGVFRIGAGTLALARMVGQVAPPLPFPNCLEPVLDWLAAETGETVMLGVCDAERGEVEYMAVVQSTQPIRFGVEVGDRRPLYSAASGQVLLAYMPDDQLRDYLACTIFSPFTPYTCDAARLAALLPGIRPSALAFDVDGCVLGASGVACPVFDASGSICAAISVAGPSERMAINQARITDKCLRAGERASRILGFREGYPR